jgi:hypothetical protein
MNAPAVVIRLELEAAPRVRVDCLSTGERDRLQDWLDANPSLAWLVTRALELTTEERAA